MTNATVSISANIAEGYVRMGVNDKLRFYNIAEGSMNECRYYIILSKDLGYVNATDSQSLYNELIVVQKLLSAYSRNLIQNTSTNY